MNAIITKTIEDAEKSGLTCFGVRHHHSVVKVGDDLGISYNAIDDQDEEKLDGICCLATSYDGFEVDDFEGDLDKLAEGNYQNGSVVLVGGTAQEYGNDQDEVVIEDAKVLWVK